MKVVIYTIVLVVVFAIRASGQKLKQCRERCITKIPDIQLCNETCVQLLNSSSASNITASLPVPDSPLLLSSSYFSLTLQWNDYSKTKYNASPVVYVLETTRHKNTSDPAIILPVIKKYHKTNTTTFTIPEQFVTKTNFSFRLAVVTVQGTSDFSPPSPLYITNDTCDRSEHFINPGAFSPCPVFNVRINFTATDVLFQEPRISSVLFWDYPHDITNLEGQLVLEVRLSKRFPYTRVQECAVFGTSFKNEYFSPHSQSRSEIYHFPPEDRLYFGCPYDITLGSIFSDEFKTVATFYIPHCIHGFCGCDFVTSNAPKRESEYIDVNVRQSNHSENKTTANVTWRNEAWGTKVPEYFRLTILECPRGTCPSLHLNHKREILLAERMKTSNSFILQNLTKGEEHWVIIAAYDKSGCLLTPTESQLFDAYSFLCYKCEERENYTKEQCEKNQKTIQCQANLKVTCFKQHIVKNDGTELEFRGCEHKTDCETRRKNCEDEAKMKEMERKECAAVCCVTDGDTPCNSGVTIPVNMIMVMVVTAACSLRLALG